MVPSLINRWYVLDLGPAALADRVAGRAGPRRLLHRLGHARRRGSLPHLRRHRRPLPRPRAARSRAREPRPATSTCSATASAARSRPSTPPRSRSGVASLLALAAPIDFDDGRHHGDVDAHADVRRRRDRRRVRQRAVAADAGVVPHAASRRCDAAKAVALLDRAWDDEFLDGFLATERWGNDNVSFPGACYARYIEELYRGNPLVTGEFTRRAAGPRSSRRSPARCSRSRSPTITSCPVASAAAADRRSSARATSSSSSHRGGHVGAVVSRKAADRLWPVMSEFWATRAP